VHCVGMRPGGGGMRRPERVSLLTLVAAVVATVVQPVRGFCRAPSLRGFPAPLPPPPPPLGAVTCARARGGRPRAWTLAADGTDADWRAFRAQLVQEEAGAGGVAGSQAREQVEAAAPAGGWAHEIWAPEAGCLLIANPVKFRGSQSYFARAVVLLTEHDEHAGSIGFLLNRPTPHTVGDVAPSLRMFAGCPLFSGGPVGDGLQFIHSLPDVHGSKEIMRGVFYGGALRACARAVCGTSARVRCRAATTHAL
jgi:putative transcriptional regulator